MAQELKACNVVATADVNPDVVDSLGCTEFAGYDADEVDAVLAEKDKEIEELKQKLGKAIAERDGNQVCIDALKQKLVSVQSSMHADVGDGGTENRRLRRALYRLRIGFAKHFGRVYSGKRVVAYWKAEAEKFKESE